MPKQSKRLPAINRIEIIQPLGIEMAQPLELESGAFHQIALCRIHFVDESIPPLLAKRSVVSPPEEDNNILAKPIFGANHPHMLRRYFHRSEDEFEPNHEGQFDVVYYELCPLGELSQFVLLRESIPQAFVGIVAAINWMHLTMGTAHCDLSPANILMGSDKRLKVCNSDLFTQDLRKVRPTQLRYSPIGDYHAFAHDAFSLAILLFTLYRSAVPFMYFPLSLRHGNSSFTLEKIHEDFTVNAAFWEQYSDVVEVIKGLTQKGPMARIKFLRGLNQHRYLQGLQAGPINDPLFVAEDSVTAVRSHAWQQELLSRRIAQETCETVESIRGLSDASLVEKLCTARSSRFLAKRNAGEDCETERRQLQGLAISKLHKFRMSCSMTTDDGILLGLKLLGEYEVELHRKNNRQSLTLHADVRANLMNNALRIQIFEEQQAQRREARDAQLPNLLLRSTANRAQSVFQKIDVRYYLPTVNRFLVWLARGITEHDTTLLNIVRCLREYHQDKPNIKERIQRLHELYSLIFSIPDFKNIENEALFKLYRAVKYELRLYDAGPWLRFNFKEPEVMQPVNVFSLFGLWRRGERVSMPHKGIKLQLVAEPEPEKQLEAIQERIAAIEVQCQAREFNLKEQTEYEDLLVAMERNLLRPRIRI